MSDQPTAEQDLVAALGALADPPKEGKVSVVGKSGAPRRYVYLTLVDLLGAVRPVFAAHNLAIMQDVETRERGVSVTTRIMHTSGTVFESPNECTRVPATSKINIDGAWIDVSASSSVMSLRLVTMRWSCASEQMLPVRPMIHFSGSGFGQ